MPEVTEGEKYKETEGGQSLRSGQTLSAAVSADGTSKSFRKVFTNLELGPLIINN